ncbi:UNVERIFIED_CONTAM: hypothetical protein HDU68_004216, partial [Siphonaria sp. JEL0065]
DIDGARAAYEESAVRHPTSDNYYNLGNCLYSLGVVALQIATEINPEDREVQYNYGVVLDSMGKLEEAIVQYEKSATNGVVSSKQESEEREGEVGCEES